MSSCWKINLSIYFRQRHLCHWRHYLFQSFGPSRVKSGCINWLLLRSFGFFRIWSPQFILNTRLLGPFYSIKIHPLLLTYSPLAFRHRNGIFAWLHSLNPHCLKCIDVKANRKKVLFKLWSNVTYLQHVYVNGHGIGKHEFSLHENSSVSSKNVNLFLVNVESSVSVFLLEEGLLNRYCDKRIVYRNVWSFCTCMCNQTCCEYSLNSITLTNNGHKFLPRIKRSLVIYDLVLAGFNFFENIK